MLFLRKHWAAIAGWGALLNLLINWAGNADFIITRIKDPDWIGSVINWIIDLPPLALLALVFVGLALIWWDTRRRPVKVAKAVAARPQRDKVTAKRKMPSGDKLITWGENLIIYWSMIALGIFFIGAVLLVIGHSVTNKLPERPREISKAPTDSPAQPPIVEKPIAEAPIDPPQAPATTPPGRVFVDKDVTPEFLVGLHEGQTSFGGKTRVSKYLGKWM